MNLDYARSVVAEHDIDIPWARPMLVRQAALEIQPFTYDDGHKTDLTDAWLMLMGEPRPAQVLAAVERLVNALDNVLLPLESFAIPVPGSVHSPALDPRPENKLSDAARYHKRAAAILDALDLLGWVMAYDTLS